MNQTNAFHCFKIHHLGVDFYLETGSSANLFYQARPNHSQGLITFSWPRPLSGLVMLVNITGPTPLIYFAARKFHGGGSLVYIHDIRPLQTGVANNSSWQLALLLSSL